LEAIMLKTLAAALLMSFVCGGAAAQTLSGSNLARHLQSGGYVLLMRHASAPTQLPSPSTADPENKNLERQLDDKGRTTATAMGHAIRTMRIPIGAILSSPTYRARQTIGFAGFGEPKTFAQLGDQGQSMDKDAVASKAGWLREKLSEPPAPRTNTVIVSHAPNIVAASGIAAVAEGETLVFQPQVQGQGVLVARVPIEQWPLLSQELP
jgi:phosphohistidine phosphatase SixA